MKRSGKLFLGVTILGFAILSASNYSFAQERSMIREDNVRPEKIKQLTKAELRSLKRTIKSMNTEIKREKANPVNRNQRQDYNNGVPSNQLYAPDEVKLLYKDSFNPKEEDGVKAEWYMGGELTQTRDVKNIRAGGKIGNFRGGAVIDLNKGTKVVNIGANIDRHSIDMMVGDNVMQGKAQVDAFGLADVKMFYNFNTQQFNYSVSRNLKGAGVALAQQFRNGVTITAATLSYKLPDGLDFIDRVVIQYVLNDFETRKNTDKLSVTVQENIGFAKVELKLEKIVDRYVPTAKISVKKAW